MQDYAQFSKFYLKRNWREKENVITFICSCISQKRQPHSRQSISGAEGHFCKEQKQKETFINKKRRIRRKTTFRTSKKEISGNKFIIPFLYLRARNKKRNIVDLLSLKSECSMNSVGVFLSKKVLWVL